MATPRVAAGVLLVLSALALAGAEDPYLFFEWKVTYGTKTLLGAPQKVILINGEFPGPRINCSSNNNILVNVFNQLDQPLLFTWNGMQHRKNTWMDGLPGTQCPIAPNTNFTYKWQPKDQIGSFFYFPSVGMQRAAGGYGAITVVSRLLIPVPFDQPPPESDHVVLVGDWFTKDHEVMARHLDAGRSIGRPEGVVINGMGGKDLAAAPMFTFEAGKAYRFRVCNTGIKASLNFRIQGHDMKLVEMDGSHTVQDMYDSLDVHVGHCFSVLVDADQKPGDYYLVASTRFIHDARSASAIIRYAGSNTPPSPNVAEPPAGWAWSLNQWRSFRWNLTASAARPNPQGSYHYGQINITRTIKLLVSRGHIDGKLRYGFNGVSHRDADTPLKLAEYFNVTDGVFSYNQMGDAPPAVFGPLHVIPNVITAEFRTFIEIVFENPEKSMDSFHLDGYAFFAVGMGPGKWSPELRKTYNLLDAVSRHTVQVYPRSWSAIMLTFDNAGMWNIRSNVWERHYLGEQLYMSVMSPARSLRDEYNMPDNALRCGKVVGLPLPPPYAPSARSTLASQHSIKGINKEAKNNSNSQRRDDCRDSPHEYRGQGTRRSKCTDGPAAASSTTPPRLPSRGHRPPRSCSPASRKLPTPAGQSTPLLRAGRSGAGRGARDVGPGNGGRLRGPGGEESVAVRGGGGRRGGAGLLLRRVPLAVLLGLHARFPSMYLVDESAVSVYDGSEGGSLEPIPPEENDTLQVNSTLKEFVPPTPKEWTNTNGSQSDTVIGNISIHPVPSIQQATVLEDSSLLNITGTDLKDSFEQGLPGDENGKSCQLQFGSYCLWSVEHEEVMKDFIVKRLKDQLFVARAYYPSIVKLDGMEKLSHEMKQNIQEHGHMLSEAISDSDLPELHRVNMAKMDQTIAAAKSCAVECTNVEKKLMQLLDMFEDEALFHARQSAYLYRLGVQTLPKSFHCLSMRLTVDYFNASADMEHSDAEKFGNPAFQHYVIFSTNLLASSMTINSSVINSEESANMVFHLMTDGQNFYAFKNWFIRNSYKGATIRVLNFEDFQVKNLGNGIVDQLSSEEFRITSNSNAVTLNTLTRTEYISMFGHSLFLLPELFTNLKRVIVLEDDTIVQRDLSLLWNLDLKGKVIGAVQFCRFKFRQLRAYLPNFPYNSSSCIWMSGVSVTDLNEWREHDVTGIHHRILEKLRHDTEASWRSAALPAGLLAFENPIHPIEDQWVQFGLGHDYGLTHGAIKKAAILHYNGNMKPWLELGIHRYRKYWKRYLPRDDVFMMDCNVNP